VELKVFY